MTDAELDLRASDSDRMTMEVELSHAFQEGRLELSELDQRVEQIRRAQTYRELHQGIVGLARAQSKLESLVTEARRRPQSSREQLSPHKASSPIIAFLRKHPVARVVCVAISGPLLLGIFDVATFVPVLAVVLYALIICSVFFALAALTTGRRTTTEESWLQGHPRHLDSSEATSPNDSH